MLNKIINTIIFLLITTSALTALDNKQTDELHRLGNYQNELILLTNSFDKNNPQPEIIWRIGRSTFEIAEKINDKELKIKKYQEAIDFLAPYLEINNGTKRERALIIHWYAANLGSKANTQGVLDSLDIVPDLRMLADKAQSIDPTFSDPYFVKARIDDRLPSLLGGDKFRMGSNMSKALELNSTDITVYVDGAKAFYNRNWSAKKKNEIKNKKGKSDGTPLTLSDREYAMKLINIAIKLYENRSNASARDKIKYNEALVLKKKWF